MVRRPRRGRDLAEETVIDYVMQVEGGSLTKTLETYSEEDGVFPNCQIYAQGGQVIEVNEDAGAIDMTQVLEPSEPVVSEEDVYRALLVHATDV
ncbi:hypothetical protein VJ923_11680 [Adlercreutzia sp. R25]|uniref:DUF1292 domain-containing protein n=1 Tax=Adlercreutzia shanghongiae TaxID=3111773 RepID=A0ABU6IWZ3_9ACTN|nr:MULTISPECIES: hypothetical protein [unclassified Adlercreutzia]MEC4273817.1 hypothetical protein [Adlercreutzia sp. R25]MEC4294127.1 hypothetical protein [Adlercreutzia sp. R22]